MNDRATSTSGHPLGDLVQTARMGALHGMFMAGFHQVCARLRSSGPSSAHPEPGALPWIGATTLSALLLSLLAAGLSEPARAQRVVPKLQDICPLGYVDTFNGKCSTLGLMNYTLAPTEGRPCEAGWMNVGGGYCRKK